MRRKTYVALAIGMAMVASPALADLHDELKVFSSRSSVYPFYDQECLSKNYIALRVQSPEALSDDLMRAAYVGCLVPDRTRAYFSGRCNYIYRRFRRDWETFCECYVPKMTEAALQQKNIAIEYWEQNVNGHVRDECERQLGE